MSTPASNTPLPRLVELHRREADGRTLVCYGGEGWYMIANEDDAASQSVVLTTEEVRWLYWEALGGKANAEGGTGRLEEALDEIAFICDDNPGEFANRIYTVADEALHGGEKS